MASIGEGMKFIWNS